jgi:hypothetical protein
MKNAPSSGFRGKGRGSEESRYQMPVQLMDQGARSGYVQTAWYWTTMLWPSRNPLQ